MTQTPTRVLMVCLGNICRSPLAEVILKHKLEQRELSAQMTVASAGTSDEHEGDDADPRTIEIAAKHGMVMDHTARQFRASDFKKTDWILVMDPSNFRNVNFMAESDEDRAKVHLITEFDAGKIHGEKVKDPWYGNLSDFEDVYQQLNRCIDGFLLHLFKK